MRWPPVHNDLGGFTECLQEMRFEDDLDQDQPPVLRFCVEYRRLPKAP